MSICFTVEERASHYLLNRKLARSWSQSEHCVALNKLIGFINNDP
jgi:hypothetical protein